LSPPQSEITLIGQIAKANCEVAMSLSERGYAAITDNPMKSRFEFSMNAETAFLVYERTDDTLTLIHTEVPPALRGHHVGDALVEAALKSAQTQGLRVVAICPFVRAYMRRHRHSDTAAE